MSNTNLKLLKGHSYLVSLPEPTDKKYDVKKEEKKIIKWFNDAIGIDVIIMWIPGAKEMKIWEYEKTN